MKDRQGNEITEEFVRQMIEDGTFCDWYSDNSDYTESAEDLQKLAMFLKILFTILDSLREQGYIYDYETWPYLYLEILNCASVRKV